jgi:transcriptional regulator with XRE-family HTH domain
MNRNTLNGETRRLRERRLAVGLTQQRIAQLAECWLSSVELLERGLTPRYYSDVMTRIEAALAPAERRASTKGRTAP